MKMHGNKYPHVEYKVDTWCALAEWRGIRPTSATSRKLDIDKTFAACLYTADTVQERTSKEATTERNLPQYARQQNKLLAVK
jgi:hypothetical protein